MVNMDFDFRKFLTHQLGKAVPLSKFKIIVDELGVDKPSAKVIQIAGTNGKGSASAYLNSILLSAGYNCGLFISPSLHKINERIRINGIQVSDQRLFSAAEKVYDAEQKLNIELGGFARLCASAMIVFSQIGLDYIILEAGIGGRIDPSNAFESILSIITHVDLDHMELLGNSVELIAEEKSNIIKHGQLAAIIHPQKPGINEIFSKKCKQMHVKPIFLDEYSTITKSISYHGQEFALYSPFSNVTYNVKTSMIAQYQQENATSAILAAISLGVDAISIIKGIENCTFPGRFELLVSDAPEGNDVLLDGAHNPDAFNKLHESLRTVFPGRACIFILAFAKEKAYDEMLTHLTPSNVELAFTTEVNERSADPKVLASLIRNNKVPVQVADNADTALEEALAFCATMEEKHPLIVVAGSLALVGYMRTLLINNKEYYPYSIGNYSNMEVDFDY